MKATLLLQSLVSLAGAWFLLGWLYRAYRVDLFRQRLFAIRDELFDMASAGRIEFANPAYGALRTLINGFIRFGDRMNVPWLLAISIAVASPDEEPSANDFARRWDENIARVPMRERERLLSLMERLHREVAWQILFASPLFTLLVFLPAALIALAAVMRRAAISEIRRRLQPRADAAAYAEGCVA